MSSFTKSAQQWATFARSWYLIDARMQPPGKIATMCAVRLQGKHKPIYHALSDVGDHVVVMNTRHIAFSGNKWEQKDLPEDILMNLTEELPQPREIPRRLNEYSQEEREAFPTLWT
ncbi:unnamed protein product, partial [Coregonus sp. 'balchen']